MRWISRYGDHVLRDDVIIFGGGNGSTAVNKLEADGTVSRVADSPFQLGVDRGLVQADTSDGGFIAFSKDKTQYGYDVPSNTWSLIGNENVSITNSTISAVIPEYNVMEWPCSPTLPDREKGMSFCIPTRGQKRSRLQHGD